MRYIFVFILSVYSMFCWSEENRVTAQDLYKASGEYDAVQMAKKEGATALVNMGGGITLEQAKAFYSNVFNSEEINNIYEQEVSKNLTQKELEEIVKFFRSDLGKKYIETNLTISRIIAEKSTENMNNLFGNE